MNSLIIHKMESEWNGQYDFDSDTDIYEEYYIYYTIKEWAKN